MFKEQRRAGTPKPADWGDPEDALNQRQFFDVMDFCLEKLPPNTARVFMMREVMELETDEICKELTINANNLWVILYRARMALRQCLEQNWFARNGARRLRRGDSRDRAAMISPQGPRPHHLLQGRVPSRVPGAGRRACRRWQRLVLRLHLSVCAAVHALRAADPVPAQAMQRYRQ